MKRMGQRVTHSQPLNRDNMEIGSSLWMRNINIEGSLSLEGMVVAQRATELQSEAQKLARQRAFLREERRRARMEEELLRQEVADFALTKKEDWIPAACLPRPGEDRVRLNVGGQVFEVSKATLRRDSASLLAVLCDDGGPLRVDNNGVIYMDRDWWTFRHVLNFFRDGTLPTNTTLLAQLYREAGYWRCETLKRVIEEQLHLYRSKFEADASSGASRRISSEDKADTPTIKDAEKGNKGARESDWWTTSYYNGKHYAIPNLEMVTASTDGREEVEYATSTTWGDKANLDAKGRLCGRCECSRSASK